MKRKIVRSVIVGSIIMVLVSFAACKGKNDSSSEAQQTLNVVLHDEYFDMSGVFEDFQQRHPNIKVEYEVGQNVDTGIYSAALADPDCADVYLLGSGAFRIMPLADAGLLEDLTDVYTQRGWDKKIAASTVDIIKRTSNNRLYEVSNGMDVFVFKYFKDDFSRLGLEPPKTYDDFWNILEVIKASGQVPIIMGNKASGSSGGHLMSALWQAIGGRDFVSDMLFGDTPYTDPRSMEAINEFKKMLDNGYINSDAISVDYAEQAAIFASRKGGYVLFHNVVPGLDRYEAEGLDMSNIGTFVLPNKDPSIPGLPVAGLSQTWIVAKNSKNKEAAYIFLDYILSPEYQQKLSQIDGGFNMGMGASLVPDIDALDIKYEYLKDALRDINKGTAYNCSPYMPGNMRTTYTQSIQEMMISNLTPNQVMENIQKSKEEELGN